MKDTYFENQVAVVTGAGGTLCSAIAVDLARLGAKVALIGRTEEKLQKTAREIESLGGVYGIYPGDVTDETRMKEIADQTERDLGPCRFLINGAGGNQMKAMTSDVYFQPDELKDTPDTPAGFFNLDVKVIESGCVDGMDSFAINQRLVGTAEQTVTVVSEKHRIKALCDIQLD